MIWEFPSSNFIHWGQKETQFSQKISDTFRKPLNDRAAIFIAKTALHMKVLSFPSTVQQLLGIYARVSRTRTRILFASLFGRIFNHAPMTTTEWSEMAMIVSGRFFDDGVGHSNKSPARHYHSHFWSFLIFDVLTHLTCKVTSVLLHHL